MKAGVLFLTIALNIITTFLRGSNKAESVIGLKQCDTLSWVIFGIYLCIDLGLCIGTGVLLRSYESPEIAEADRNTPGAKSRP